MNRLASEQDGKAEQKYLNIVRKVTAREGSGHVKGIRSSEKANHLLETFSKIVVSPLAHQNSERLAKLRLPGLG